MPINYVDIYCLLNIHTVNKLRHTRTPISVFCIIIPHLAALQKLHNTYSVHAYIAYNQLIECRKEYNNIYFVLLVKIWSISDENGFLPGATAKIPI